MAVLRHDLIGDRNARIDKLVAESLIGLQQEILSSDGDVRRRERSFLRDQLIREGNGADGGIHGLVRTFASGKRRRIDIHRRRKGTESPVLRRIVQRVNQRAVTAHGEAGNIRILRPIRDREHRADEIRKLILDEGIKIVAAALHIALVLGGNIDDGDVPLLREQLHIGVARPLGVVVAVSVKKVEHGILAVLPVAAPALKFAEIVRNTVHVGAEHAHGLGDCDGRDHHRDIYRSLQCIADKVAGKLGHYIPP